jgi:hypothetical protein
MAHPENNKPEKQKKQYKPRAKTKYALPSLYTSLENLIQILKGYVIGSNNGQKPVNYKEVATLVNLHPARVSDNNRFLEENNMLVEKKRGRFVPSSEIVSFAKSLPWDLDKAKYFLSQKLESAWFYTIINDAFRIKGTLDEEGLVRILGSASQAASSQQTSLKRIIELLEYANIIEKDEKGVYTFVKQPIDIEEFLTPPSQADSVSGQVDSVGGVELVDFVREKYYAEKPPRTKEQKLSIPINININLNVSADSFESDVEKVKKFFEELKNLLSQEEGKQ